MCNGLGQAQLVEFGAHDVLEHGSSDGDTDRHAQSAHEGVHGGGTASVLGTAHSLDADVDAGEEHAVADAKHPQDRGPYRCRRFLIKKQQEPASDGRDHPTTPHGPSIATNPCGQKGNDDAAGEKEARDWEDVQPRLRRLLEFDGREVEWDVVECTEKLQTWEKLAREGGGRTQQTENGVGREGPTMKPWNRAQA